MAEDKGNPPTERKRERARRDGQVLRSPIVSAAAGITIWYLTAKALVSQIILRVRSVLECCFVPSSGMDWEGCVRTASGVGAISILVLCGAVAVAGLGLELVQSGVRFDFSLVAPKLSRLNPAGGLKRMCRGAAGSWSGYLSVGLCLVAAGSAVSAAVSEIAAAGWEGGVKSGLSASACVDRMLAVLWVAGMFDYWRRRRSYLRELSMSHEEVRREFREEEGDPHVRAMRRMLHGSLLFEELKARVRRSKVIVVE